MSQRESESLERREYLRYLGGTGVAGAGSMLAGCTGGGDRQETETKTTDGTRDTTTEEQPSSITKGGEMKIAMQADRTDPMWPHWQSDATGAQFATHFANRLTWVDDEGNVHGDLAEGPPETDDAQSYTFKIREGVKFHPPYDREVTADDVVKNWYAILDPSILGYEDYPTAGRWPFPGLLWGENIDTEKRVRKTGKYEVTFDLAKPSAAFPALVSIGQCSILPLEAYENNPDKIGSVDFGTFGTGPFTYEEGKAGDHYTFTRFDNYFESGEYGQLPYLDQITYRIIPEASVRVTNLKTGNIHLAETIPATDVESIGSTEGVRAISKPGASHIENYLNIRYHEPFKLFEEDPQPDAEPPGYGTINESGKKMRQAVRYATGTEQIIKTKFAGKAEPKYSPVPPFNWAYDESAVQKFEYNPQKAKQLLQETGNQNFKFTAWATNQPRFVDTATIAQQTMRQAGINMEVVPKEKSAVWGPVIGNWKTNGVNHEKTGYEAHFEDIGSGLDPADYFAQVMGGNGINYCYFGHKKSDKLIQSASETTDREKRKELYSKAQEIVTPLVPMNGICWPYVNQGILNSVKNYSVKRSSFRFRLHDVWLDQK